MLQLAPTCPECLSRATVWLPATSDVAIVDYFRCERCGCVWVVGDSPEQTHFLTPTKTKRTQPMLMFLYVDLEAGLLFARLAQQANGTERRWMLRMKSRKAHDVVTRFLPTVEMSDYDHDRLCIGLQALDAEIAKIPA